MSTDPHVPSDAAQRIARLEQKLSATVRLVTLLTVGAVIWLGALSAGVGYLALRPAKPARSPRLVKPASPRQPAAPRPRRGAATRPATSHID